MPSKENTDTLLKEYGFCDAQIGRLDALIWQTASLIYPISLAGFAYFGTSATHNPGQIFFAPGGCNGIDYFTGNLVFTLSIMVSVSVDCFLSHGRNRR